MRRVSKKSDLSSKRRDKIEDDAGVEAAQEDSCDSSPFHPYGDATRFQAELVQKIIVGESP
jgi:hypothetical protein